MPIFKFSKAFGIARDLRVFLDLRGGITRGPVQAGEGHEGEPEKLREIIVEQRAALEDKDREIRDQAERLNIARKRADNRSAKQSGKSREIFRLKTELHALQEQAERASSGGPAPRVVDEPATGALPDFVIIGAAKSGTTSLFDLLTRHPDVEPGVLKEMHYFDQHFDRGIEWYRSLFPSPGWKDGRRSITGEASPRYVFHPRVPERMAEVVPHARLITLLRNPVDRAYSHYYHAVMVANEPRWFEDAMAAEMEWLADKEVGAPNHEHRARSVSRPRINYLERGIYVDQLVRWSKFYSREQMLVLKSEDFFERELDTLKLVLNFLDLAEWEPAETPEISNKGLYEQEMDLGVRRWLEDYFEPHNQRLYEYLGVDFGW